MLLRHLFSARLPPPASFHVRRFEMATMYAPLLRLRRKDPGATRYSPAAPCRDVWGDETPLFRTVGWFKADISLLYGPLQHRKEPC